MKKQGVCVKLPLKISICDVCRGEKMSEQNNALNMS